MMPGLPAPTEREEARLWPLIGRCIVRLVLAAKSSTSTRTPTFLLVRAVDSIIPLVHIVALMDVTHYYIQSR